MELEAACLEAIIGVHSRVDGEIHATKPWAQSRRGRGDSVPGVDTDSHVVIPVQKGDGPLTQDDEERIAKLGDF